MQTSLIAALWNVAAACLLIASSAGAAERGFYVGGLYGEADKNLEQAPFANTALSIYEGFEFSPQQIDSDFDTGDSAYSIFAGYRWLKNLAFEAGFMDLGSVVYSDEASGIDLVDDSAGTWSQRIASSTSGFSLSALGILPLSYRTEVFVRGGVLISNGELSFRISDGIGSLSQRGSESDLDFLAGAGLGFTFMEIYTLRLEYQRVFDAGKASTGEADVDLYALGVSVMF